MNTNPKTEVVIVGAGGAGRALLSWMLAIPEAERDFEPVGFLDENPKALEGYPCAKKWLGKPDEYAFGDNQRALIAFARPMARRQVVFDQLKARGVSFFTFIAPDARIGQSTRIDEGCVVCPGCRVSTNVHLGPNVFLNLGAQIGHDCRVGAHSALMGHVDLGGACTIGSRALLGMQAVVAPEKTICDDAQISCGTIVMRNIGTPGVYYGNPAVRLR